MKQTNSTATGSAKSKDDIIALYRIAVWIHPEEVKAVLHKYKVKRTKHNFIGQMLTDQDDADGFSHVLGISRIPVEDLMRVKRMDFHEKVSCVAREIHFLEGQREEALNLLRASAQKQVDYNLEMSQKVHTTWYNRPMAIREKRKKHDSQPSQRDIPDNPGEGSKEEAPGST